MPNEVITIRLPKDLDKQITAIAKKLRLSRSDVVRMALQKYADDFGDNGIRPYEKVKNLLGVVESGIPDLGSDHRKYLLERIKRA